MPRFGVSNWRAPSLPGANAPVPPGGHALAMSSRRNRELQKLLRTFDNVKTVAALAPYAQSAEELRDAVLAELSARGYVGPTVASIVDVSILQDMWARILFDRAARVEDEKLSTTLASAASAVGDASRANKLAAHALHDRTLAQEAESRTVDPLAAFEAAEAPSAGSETDPLR